MQKNFDLIELESKINTLIQKQMEPHITTFYKNQALLLELQSKFKTQIKESQVLGDKFEPLFTEFSSQMKHIRSQIHSLEQRNVVALEEKQRKIDKLENDSTRISQIAENMELTKIQLSQELKDMKTRNELFKQTIEKLLDTINNSNQQQCLDLRIQLKQFEQSQQKLSLIQIEQDANLKKIQVKLNDFAKQTHDIQIDLLTNSNQLDIDKQKFIDQNQAINSLKGYLSVIDSAQVKIKQIEYYLAYYIQYHVQNQISDSLFISFPIQFYFKYTQHEKMKFDHFDKQILAADKESDVQQLINYHQQIVKDTTLRHKKIQETIKNMQQEKHSSSDEENIQQVGKSFIQIEEAKEKKKRKQSTNLVYFEEQLRQLKEYFELKISDINNQISITNGKIKQVSDELYSQQTLFQAEIDKQLQVQSMKAVHQIEKLENNVSSLINGNNNQQLEFIIESILQFKQFQGNISNATAMIAKLLKQDEEDKQNMRLIGAKEQNIDDVVLSQGNCKSSTFQLTQNCLSCSGSPIQLLQFFKVACLSYKPSNVLMNGKFVKRSELLEQCLELVKSVDQRKQQQKHPQLKKQADFKQRSSSIQAQPSFFSTTEKSNKTSRLRPLQYLF